MSSVSEFCPVCDGPLAEHTPRERYEHSQKGRDRHWRYNNSPKGRDRAWRWYCNLTLDQRWERYLKDRKRRLGESRQRILEQFELLKDEEDELFRAAGLDPDLWRRKAKDAARAVVPSLENEKCLRMLRRDGKFER